MTKALPLAGINIVVTRPREQAARLIQDISNLGGNAISFPLLEITPLTNAAPLQALCKRLHEFQLAIFISPNAVRFGMAAIQKQGGIPSTLQIATIGLSSAQALHDIGISKVISPQQRFDSEALLELPELQQVAGLHVVIFRGDQGRELLGDTLKLRGATVEYASCYQRSKPKQNIDSLLAQKPDVLSVSSSESLNYLTQMLASSNRSAALAFPLFVSHHRIALAARDLGWQNVITTDAGDAGLLTGLLSWSEQQRGPGNE
jgi:uroporphyrinogen-III synthase